MYKGYRPTYTSTASGPQAQLNSLLERIENIYKQEDLSRLLFLTDLSMKSFGESMIRLKLPSPANSDHLANVIYEKMMTVKNRNR